jgi:hypothetical protein
MPAIDHFPDWNEALREYRTTEAPAVRASFEARLRDAFFVVGFLMPQADSGGMGVGRMIAATNNGNVLIYFTSEDRIPESDNTAELSATVFTFQELYEEMLRDKSMAGVVINPNREGNTKNALILTRREVNRIADTARDAGQDDIFAREFEYSYHATDIGTPEERRAFAEALSSRPEAREGYILASNVAWREEEADLQLTFAVDFDGGEAEAKELHDYLDAALKPVMGGKPYRIDKPGEGGLRAMRSLAAPAYVRDDLKAELDAVNAARPREFENWDEETAAFLANRRSEGGAGDPKVTEAYEDKLYASGFHVAFTADGHPHVTRDPKLGILMMAFSSRREMLKVFKPGNRSVFWRFPAIATAFAHYKQLSGLCVNSHGVRLLMMRRQIDTLGERKGGTIGVNIDPRRAPFAIARARSVPPGLGQAVADALRYEYDVRSAYYMRCSVDGKEYLPFIAADFDGPEESVYAAINMAFKRIMGGDAHAVISKADGGGLDQAQTVGELIYSRDDAYVCP